MTNLFMYAFLGLVADNTEFFASDFLFYDLSLDFYSLNRWLADCCLVAINYE